MDGATDDRLIPPPPATAFATWSMGWTVLGRSSRFKARPVSVDRFGTRLVVYRTSAGRLVAMDARCHHMGSDLSAGEVRNDCVQCPFHGWQFDATGQCTRVPAASCPPTDARQPTFAVVERGGLAYAFLAEVAGFPLPSFSVDADDLVGAPPFDFIVRCPWWMIGTNGFDLQHFQGAHDRELVDAPVVSTPHPAARRIVANFAVCGDSWRDRIAKRLSGPTVRMHITSWAGTLILVEATTQHRTTYGMTEIRPLPADDGSERALVRVRIFAKRRSGRIIDAIDARIRANFIRAFMRPDSMLLDRARYDPSRFIAADRVMADYLRWLAPVSHGRLDEPTSDAPSPSKEMP